MLISRLIYSAFLSADGISGIFFLGNILFSAVNIYIFKVVPQNLGHSISYTRLHVGPAKTQTSLRISADWSEFSQGTLLVAKDTKHLQADS